MKYIKTFEELTTEITEIENLEELEGRYKIVKVDGFYKIKLNDILSEMDTEVQ